jgi:pyruvate dehydrogenase E1 component
MDPKIPREVGNPHDPDADPLETAEWIEALDALIEAEGKDRATFLLRRLLQHARTRRVPLPQVLATPYVNTIALAEQPPYQGNLDIESRISSLVRWNALAMVVRANRASGELGGHIASYASAADLFEVGFNHFFRAGERGDLVYFQPHSAPGVYARAFLEGRLTEENLDNYRRETGGKGLSSYPHPWLMPNFWQFPTGSMGLGPLFAIYQARFMRYLQHRGLVDNDGRKVWAFVGDGEMDEPESLAGLSIAAREKLDNLVLVVNCNLQRLDGPVRGNGSIVQELEGLFAGAGWNVIKLLWSSDWDPLFARDTQQWLEKRFLETVDGEFQTYAATDGAFNREHFFNRYPELQQLVAHLSDGDIDRLRRGGHDPVKIFAAYWHAARHAGQPTVILAKTKKGYGMGTAAQGRMTTHQQKKLDTEQLIAFRDRFALPITDAQCDACAFMRPERSAPEMAYLHARREKLGGYLPARTASAAAIATPPATAFAKFALEADGKEMSTTVAFVRMVQGCCATHRSASASCPSSRTRRAPSAWRISSGRSASTRPSASSTSRRTSTSFRTTRKRPRARSSRKASTKRAPSRRGSPRPPATRRTAIPCCRCTSTTRCSVSSAWATRSGRRRTHARAGSSSAPPRAARRSRARGCSTRTARATSSPPRSPTAAPTTVLRLRARGDLGGRHAPDARRARGRLLLRDADE